MSGTIYVMLLLVGVRKPPFRFPLKSRDQPTLVSPLRMLCFEHSNLYVESGKQVSIGRRSLSSLRPFRTIPRDPTNTPFLVVGDAPLCGTNQCTNIIMCMTLGDTDGWFCYFDSEGRQLYLSDTYVGHTITVSTVRSRSQIRT